MKKFFKRTLAVVMATATLMTASTAFAYTNSTGSTQGDIGILDDAEYDVTGSDTTQNKASEYTTVTYASSTVTSAVDVYATIAEGEDVYDPTNAAADANGFVDGSIVVGLPTVLIMSGTPDANGYYTAVGKGKVKGNIAGTTIINVTPEASFAMSQIGKSDITATVTQTYTQFVVPTSSVTGANVNKNVTPAFNDDATFVITVKTNQATAGSWHGSFNETISLTTAA